MTASRVVRFYFRWSGPLIILAGLLIVAATLALMILPNETVQNLVIFVSPIFSKGGIRNAASVVQSIRKALILVIFMGIAFIVSGGLLSYFTSLLLRKTNLEVPSVQQDRLLPHLDKYDLFLIVQIGIFLLLTLPAMSRSLDYDEAWTMRYVDGSWPGIFAPNESNNHVFSTVLIKISITLFGETEAAIRVPALLAGICLIIGVYFLAKTVSRSLPAANMAALLSATSYGILFTSVSARGYAIVMATAVWMGYLLLHIQTSRRRLVYPLYVLIGTIAITTLPTAVIVVLAFVAAIIYRLSRSEISASTVLHALHLTLLVTVLSLAVYAWSLPDRLIWMGGRRPLLTDIPDFVLTNIFSNWALEPGSALMGLIVVLLSATGLVAVWRKNHSLTVYIGITILGAAAIHISGALDPFWYSAVGLVFVPFLVSQALYLLYEQVNGYRYRLVFRAAAIGSAMLIIAVNLTVIPTIRPPVSNARDIASILKESQATTSTSVAVVHLVPMLEYYFRRDKVNFQDYSSLSLDNTIQNYDVIVFYGTPKEAPELASAGRFARTVGSGGDIFTLFYRPEFDLTFSSLTAGSN